MSIYLPVWKRRLVCGCLGQQQISYPGLMYRAPLTHTAQADICRFSGFDKLLLKWQNSGRPRPWTSPEESDSFAPICSIVLYTFWQYIGCFQSKVRESLNIFCRSSFSSLVISFLFALISFNKLSALS